MWFNSETCSIVALGYPEIVREISAGSNGGSVNDLLISRVSRRRS